ncbi:MAG: hypothetical protein KIT35_27750 [Piscinibacter sp.]|uniref:hypothetical protein n=1 Tax=Piscinibacter sp. TaxID=1903157 RepID=UPI002586DA3B|nr:hypothetical protein [Piscinibacter sp.]MCW5667647.1 hypothetical protein [Piscinibacter sp.]
MALRYIDWVDNRIQGATSEVDSGIYRAKKAAYLARTGDVCSAVELIEYTKANALRRNVDYVAIYATFVDGIIAFYQDMVDEAHDKWNRAKALSKAVGAVSILANASAWLAHHAFGRFDLGALEENLSEAFQLVDDDDSECLSRIFLVLAEALHICGDRALANEWYTRSRVQALLSGDDATISSIMYNRAAMGIACARQEFLRASPSDIDARLVMLEAESTDNFDKLIGVVSLESFTPILKAQTYSLAGRFSDAEAIYAVALAQEPSKAQMRHRGWLVADRAYCLAKSGAIEKAESLARVAVEYISDDIQIDDLAALHSRLSTVYDLTNDASSKNLHAKLAAEYWDRFAEFLGKLRDTCCKFSNQRSRFPLV